MTKYLLFLLPLLGFSSSINMDKATLRPLGKIIHTNAEITQLSEQKQEIVSRLPGHIESYYVTAGQTVKTGDKIALIESIELSKMSAEYVSVLKQTKAAQKQLVTAKTLHTKGLSSQNDISNAIINLEEIRAKENALMSQLNSLGINPEKITEATDKYTLYAHSDGGIGKILSPLHANVDAQTPLMTLVNQSGYYAVAYLGVKDAMEVGKDTKGWVNISSISYPCHFVQLLPHIDKETQRAKVLFKIDNSPSNLLLGAYTQMDISLSSSNEVITIKKSALTLFQGEWVVFVEVHRDEHEVVEDHEGHAHGTHAKKEYDELETEEEVPYQAKVVDILSYSGDYVAIRGLEAGEVYVSDGVYFVKSMLLKSSLGGHGH